MAHPKTLADLFHDLLKDVYYAERQIVKALPKMARAAQSPELKRAFEDHLAQTETHIERLQQVFDVIGKPARGKTCPAMDGLLEEGEEAIAAFKDSPALDAALIAGAQAVEHYEISRYGTLRAWAELMAIPEAVELLDKTLDEEADTDEMLGELATSQANPAAAAGLRR
ncbi:ferritin-like domain-containing protein [Paracoccus sp. p4-l81]|uniref:YciE/YciF ferroxidase family protein n=1 Tax=Paracoccus sp. p4-l81 TaxID=3342806 RepID=UPI0035B9AF81